MDACSAHQLQGRARACLAKQKVLGCVGIQSSAPNWSLSILAQAHSCALQDTMIAECGIVESGPSEQRCQVVRWLRTFPFSFINQREYILARRLWRRDGCLYSACQQLCRFCGTKLACRARPLSLFLLQIPIQ